MRTHTVESRRSAGFPRSRPGRSRRVWWGGGAAVVLASGLAASMGAPEAPDPGPGARLATRAHANEAGSYVFAHPPGWRVRDEGSASRLVSPRRDVAISFGEGAKGGLRGASIQLVSEIEASYRHVDLIGFQLNLIGGEPAISFVGRATGGRGVPLRFQAITVAGPRRNYQVSVFASANADPGDVLPPIQEIVGSFRIV
jgi:hypothetical protein